MSTRRRVAACLALAVILPSVVLAQTGAYKLRKVSDGYEHPVGLTNAGDGSGRVFVVEQRGRISLLGPGARGETFLDIHERIIAGGEQGLLSIAFHPKFTENGRCFVNYTAQRPKLTTVISEFTVPKGAAAADPASERILLTIDQPYSNHNGGQNAFGPDGYLYIGMGDGGAGGDPHGHGQNLGSLLGKMLRIDVDSGRQKGYPYMIPGDNPFVKTAGARPEIWALGLRNPWRFSFDRVTGHLWAADVGQNAWEEVDVVEKGKNYGWNVMEGAHCFRPKSGCDTSGLTPPVKDYRQGEGNNCVVGGLVYRGKSLPALAGAYLYGDFGSGRIWSLRLKDGAVVEDRELLVSKKRITAFGDDETGELFVVTHGGGIWQLESAGAAQ